jgi:hypothetical protein
MHLCVLAAPRSQLESQRNDINNVWFFFMGPKDPYRSPVLNSFKGMTTIFGLIGLFLLLIIQKILLGFLDHPHPNVKLPYNFFAQNYLFSHFFGTITAMATIFGLIGLYSFVIKLNTLLDYFIFKLPHQNLAEIYLF